ncbi:hypothetical protein KTN05_02720 [Paracoccus sp. Z118]|uniref:hypothetical protein n=1 Tax=Paracoccus sp. Z118 TaxID=2851017 RepID=UPI001C2B9DB3|nr:hypothetical protein [Paracoccus sp. Z118]MBV0890761.1 hypothetical protein [Paracoccus sp. Z118]
MAAAILRLQSFDQPLPLPEAMFTQADLDAAHERGASAGAAQAHDAQLAEIISRLSALAATIREAADRRAAVQAEVIAALAPMLLAFADGALPILAQCRLEAALRQELQRLADTATPLAARLCCGPDQSATLQQCLSDLPDATFELDPTGPEGTVELAVAGGRITFDRAALAESFRALLMEILDGAPQ